MEKKQDYPGINGTPFRLVFKEPYFNTGYKEEDDVKSPKNINKVRETVEKVCKNGKRI